jgi:hypothetical protein
MKLRLTVCVALAILALTPAALYAQVGGWGQPQQGQQMGQPGQMMGQPGQMPGMGMGMPGQGMGMPGQGMGMMPFGMNPMMMGGMGRTPAAVPPVMLINDGIIYIAYDGKLSAFDAKTLERIGEAIYWERAERQGPQPGGPGMPGAPGM